MTIPSFKVYRQVFEFLIQEFKTYKPLLASIKNEYETYVNELKEKVVELEPLKVSYCTTYHSIIEKKYIFVIKKILR